MDKSTIDDILKRLRLLEAELETEIDRVLNEKRALFRYTLTKGKVQFESGIRKLQKHHRTGVLHYLLNAHLGHLFTAPIIYSVIVPIALLDLMGSFYQHTCFRVYGIPRVVRSKYIIIDRQHLVYLNFIEKLNCIYCGYSNGVIEYVREIAAKTEQYWCPIKHAQRSPEPHRHMNNFIDYGDAEAYRMRFKAIRKEIRDKG
ncbi:MAG: hypothetical protein OQL19_14900 [Gammaproteobacteria bacterium]|nr:hypothetical protein [Gammaproteobacteria bacterium]